MVSGIYLRNREIIFKNMEIVKELLVSELPVEQQVRIFKEKTDKGRRTFYRYKKALKLNMDIKNLHYLENRSYNRFINRGEGCYMCYNEDIENLIIHHINMNRKDNRKNNLLVLCDKCHTKIHFIFKKFKQLGGFMNSVKMTQNKMVAEALKGEFNDGE